MCYIFIQLAEIYRLIWGFGLNKSYIFIYMLVLYIGTKKISKNILEKTRYQDVRCTPQTNT